MLGTMSNGDSGSTSKDLQVVQAVMADASAKTVPKVMGLQWGMLDLYEGKTSGVSPSTFNTGNMPVWATEHKCGNYPWNPSGYPAYKEPAPNDQAYAVESWGYIRRRDQQGRASPPTTPGTWCWTRAARGTTRSASGRRTRCWS